MVKIRITRMGRHKLPFYRIVVTDSRNRRDGSYIELLGHYEPLLGKIDIQKDNTIKWLNNGAQPSETVLSILKKEGIWKEYQENRMPKKPKKSKRKVSATKKKSKNKDKSKKPIKKSSNVKSIEKTTIVEIKD